MSVKNQVADLMAAWAKRAEQLANEPEQLTKEQYELVDKLQELGCIVGAFDHEVKDGQVYCNVSISIPKE
jgi:hypothetical protein